MKSLYFYIYINVFVYTHSIKIVNLFCLELLISTPNDFLSLCSIPNNRKPEVSSCTISQNQQDVISSNSSRERKN